MEWNRLRQQGTVLGQVLGHAFHGDGQYLRKYGSCSRVPLCSKKALGASMTALDNIWPSNEPKSSQGKSCKCCELGYRKRRHRVGHQALYKLGDVFTPAGPRTAAFQRQRRAVQPKPSKGTSGANQHDAPPIAYASPVQQSRHWDDAATVSSRIGVRQHHAVGFWMFSVGVCLACTLVVSGKKHCPALARAKQKRQQR